MFLFIFISNIWANFFFTKNLAYKEKERAKFSFDIGVGNSYYRRGGYYYKYVPPSIVSTYCNCKIDPYAGYIVNGLVSPYFSINYNHYINRKNKIIKRIVLSPHLTYNNLGYNLHVVHDSIVRWNPTYTINRRKVNRELLSFGLKVGYNFHKLELKVNFRYLLIERESEILYFTDNSTKKFFYQPNYAPFDYFIFPELGYRVGKIRLNFLFFSKPGFNKYVALTLSNEW